jgi:hypothetical protein
LCLFWKLGEEQVSLVSPPLFGGNPAMRWMTPWKACQARGIR